MWRERRHDLMGKEGAMRRGHRRSLGALVTILSLALSTVGLATPVGAAGGVDHASLQWHPDADEVGEVGKGARTSLHRFPEAVDLKVHSRELDGDHAFTIWLVVFNEPGDCSDPCGMDDIFVDGDPNKGLNSAKIEEADISVFWGTGGVANAAGVLEVDAHVEEEDPPGQVLFGNGLTDAMGAEIHVVIRDHGPASDDPETLEEQITTFGGGCDVFPCVDVQFSVHFPA